MACDVKRAYGLCSDFFLALLTRLCESRRSGSMEASQRPGLTGAGEVMQDRIGFWTARAFLCVVAFGVMIYRRMHQTPIRRSAPAGAKLVETATRAEVGSVIGIHASSAIEANASICPNSL
jgi:hypothetical protein